MAAPSIDPPPVTPETALANRTRRRVTRRLLPFLMLLYLFAFIDRANVGIAKLQMQGDLKLTDAMIGFGAGVFFFGYFLLEVPSTLIVERWSARKWLARIMITWGIVASATGFIGMPVFGHSTVAHQFFAARFLLGAAEAGFFPGVIVYLSHWFRSEHRARAKAWFMVTQPLSVVIGLPVSRWILETVHWHGLAGWRWVFLLEGLPCILLGIVCARYLTDHPAQATWLPEDEKAWLISGLEAERRARIVAGRVRISDAFRQPYTLLLIAIYFLVVTGNQGLLFFLPSITNEMKSMSISARTLVTTLPYLFSICGILLNGFWASRTGEKRWHTAGPMLISGSALVLAVLSGDRLASGNRVLLSSRYSLASISACLLDLAGRLPRPVRRRHRRRLDQFVWQSRGLLRPLRLWLSHNTHWQVPSRPLLPLCLYSVCGPPGYSHPSGQPGQ